MSADFDSRLSAFLASEALPGAYRAVASAIGPPIADAIADAHRVLARPILVGVNGAQGTGKTTLCRLLGGLLLPDLGLDTATLSLDDLYLTRTERHRLARDVHPLFETRGVPGTHDMALGVRLVDALLQGRGPVSLPRFDKSRDNRAPDAEGETVAAPVDVLLFEGWCVGVEPQAEAALAGPVNALEAEEDSDAIWRRHANAALAGSYRTLFARIDLLVMLRPPDFDSVIANRRLQEEKLRASPGIGDAVMDEAALDRFVSHYERITRHMFETLPDKADILVDFSSDRRVAGIRLPDG